MMESWRYYARLFGVKGVACWRGLALARMSPTLARLVDWNRRFSLVGAFPTVPARSAVGKNMYLGAFDGRIAPDCSVLSAVSTRTGDSHFTGRLRTNLATRRDNARAG
jgi:hypothetical protein